VGYVDLNHGPLPYQGLYDVESRLGGTLYQGPGLTVLRYENRAQLEKSDPRARSDTERPVKRLPAPGLETTSAIKQSSASAGSNQPRFSARNGHPGTGYQGLRRTFHDFLQRANAQVTRQLDAL